MSIDRKQLQEIRFPNVNDDRTIRRDATDEKTTGGGAKYDEAIGEGANVGAAETTGGQKSPLMEIIVDLTAKHKNSYLCVQLYSGKPHFSCGGATGGGPTGGGVTGHDEVTGGDATGGGAHGREESPVVQIIVDLTAKHKNYSYLCVQLYPGKPPISCAIGDGPNCAAGATGRQKSPVVQIIVDLATKYINDSYLCVQLYPESPNSKHTLAYVIHGIIDEPMS